MSNPLRLGLDGDALVSNWRWLDRQSGRAACGAAVKADGYGLGAREVVRRLIDAGCRDFFVATWTEAADIAPLVGSASLAVLHGLRADDVGLAGTLPARPVLNTPEQVLRWRAIGGGLCDVMIDTGMNRLGLTAEQACSGLLDGIMIDTLHSHLACADEDVPANARQLANFLAVAQRLPARRNSIANSAGICLGNDYSLDLTRPGLALYGGVPRAEAAGHIRQVASPEAEVLQVRPVTAGDTVGYNATWTASGDATVAIINIGYADGYARAFSNRGLARWQGCDLPVIGRVSMDLVALELPEPGCPGPHEGDWITLAFDLPAAAEASGLSQYELLTGLGQRFERQWLSSS